MTLLSLLNLDVHSTSKVLETKIGSSCATWTIRIEWDEPIFLNGERRSIGLLVFAYTLTLSRHGIKLPIKYKGWPFARLHY